LGALEGRQLVWHAEEDGPAVTYTRDPEARFGRRVQNFLLSLLPLDNQL